VAIVWKRVDPPASRHGSGDAHFGLGPGTVKFPDLLRNAELVKLRQARSAQDATVCSEDKTIDGGHVLPGWYLNIAELFRRLDRNPYCFVTL
jgi:hypothetical protein